MEYFLLTALGTGAGLLTTLAGLGGGMMLVITLSWIFSPDLALAATAPALLIGNGHRVWLLRRALLSPQQPTNDRQDPGPSPIRVATWFSAAALPAAFVGGLVAVNVPMDVLRWLLVLVTVLALAREAGLIQWHPKPASLLPAAVLSGFLTATSSGGALVVAPSIRAAGLRAEQYVAAASAIALMMHVGRVPAYALGGWFTQESLIGAAILVVAIIAGNAIGTRLRPHLGERLLTGVTIGALIAGLAVACLGAM